MRLSHSHVSNQGNKNDSSSSEKHTATSVNISNVAKVDMDKKSIKGILKGDSCAKVILICEKSGTPFEGRCLRLYKSLETTFGRFTEVEGELPNQASENSPNIMQI